MTSTTSLYIDEGSGYSLVAGSSSYAYHRNSSDGSQSVSKSVITTLAAGAKVKIAASRDGANQAIITLDDGVNLHLQRI